MARQRDNFQAGIFVVVGLLLAGMVIYILADFSRFTQKLQTVKVYYQLNDGVQGLKEGATVSLGDQPMGKVAKIAPFMDPQSPARVIGLLIDIQLPDSLKLYWDAQIELVVPPLGSGTTMNIRSVGGIPTGKKTQPLPLYNLETTIPIQVIPTWVLRDPKTGQTAGIIDRTQYSQAQLLAMYTGPKNAIPGVLAGSDIATGLTQSLGIEARQRQQIKEIIANVANATGTLKNQLPVITKEIETVLKRADTISAKVDQSVDKAQTAMDDIKALTALFKERSEIWAKQFDASLTDVQEMTRQVKQLITDKKMALGQTLDNLKETTDNFKKVSQEVREKTLMQVSTALDKAIAAMKNFQATSKNIKTMVAVTTPALEKTMANSQMIADQLKLTAIEIRRSPWRLLYKPEKVELETDNLYDAARSFVLASGALENASASLDATVKSGQADPVELQRVMKHLTTIFERFQEVEKVFWKQLGAVSKSAK